MVGHPSPLEEFGPPSKALLCFDFTSHPKEQIVLVLCITERERTGVFVRYRWKLRNQ